MVKWMRKFWTGSEVGCFIHSWDNKHLATRTCNKCGYTETMSHL